MERASSSITPGSAAIDSMRARSPPGEPTGAVLRQRDQRRPALRWRPDHGVPQGRDQRPRGRRRRDGQTRGPRHQGELVLPIERPRPRDRRAPAPAPSTAGRASSLYVGRRPVRRRLRPGDERPRADADDFYAGPGPGRPDAVHTEKRRIVRQAAPDWSGASRSTRTGCAPGSTAIRASRRHRRSGAAAVTGAGDISTPSTCWPCPTPGSTRGSPPGTSPSTRSVGPTSIRRSRSTSWSSCSGSGSSIPTAPCPRTSGASTTSTHPCTRWPRCGSSPSTAAPIWTFSNGCSRSCCSTSPGG